MNNHQQFADNLRATEHYLSQLLDLLQQETNTLSTRDADKLTQLAQDKQSVLNQLESLTQHRITLLQANNLTHSNDDIETFINQSPQAHDLKQRWQSILQHLKDNFRQNVINGSVISTSQHNNHRLLHILHGTSDKQDTYNTSGKIDSLGDSNGSIEI